MDQDLIRAACTAQPGFDAGTAYDRTKICCRVLVEHGESVPSWMVIREIVGKGSSGDINRAVKDFRAEHADMLRQMSGVTPGVPEKLAPHIRGFWEAALAAVRAEYEESVQRWEQLVADADARAEKAADALSAAEERIAALESRLEVAHGATRSLESQLDVERSARQQAERLFETHSRDMEAQRLRLEETIRESKQELERAAERMEGERRYALKQIDEARASAAAEIGGVRAQFEREKAQLQDALSRLNETVGQLQVSKAAAERAHAVAQQEAADLRARLSRAESLSDKLAADNQRLVDALKTRAAAPAPRARKAVLRKNR